MAKGSKGRKQSESDFITLYGGSLINAVLVAAVLGKGASAINQQAVLQVHTKQLDIIEQRIAELDDDLNDKTLGRFNKEDGVRMHEEKDALRDKVHEIRTGPKMP